MKEEIKKWITDKALSLVFGLISTLVISVGGHLWGTHKLNEAQNDRDKYRHERDSLKTESIERKYGN